MKKREFLVPPNPKPTSALNMTNTIKFGENAEAIPNIAANADVAKKLIDESGLKVQSAILLSEAAALVGKAVA